MWQGVKNKAASFINFQISMVKMQFAALGVLLVSKISYDWYYAKSDQMGFLDAVKAGISHAFSFGKMIVTKLPDIAYKFNDIAYNQLEKIPPLVEEFNAGLYEAYKWGYDKIAYLASKTQDVACSVTSTVDDVVNYSPCLYKVSQEKDYAFVHDVKTILFSSSHVVTTFVLNAVLPKTATTKSAIIGLNIAAGWLEGNILNSVAGLQTFDATQK